MASPPPAPWLMRLLMSGGPQGPQGDEVPETIEPYGGWDPDELRAGPLPERVADAPEWEGSVGRQPSPPLFAPGSPLSNIGAGIGRYGRGIVGALDPTSPDNPGYRFGRYLESAPPTPSVAPPPPSTVDADLANYEANFARSQRMNVEDAAKEKAQNDAGRMRAIRMPGGKLLFTNTNDYDKSGGSEVTSSQAGKTIRTADLAAGAGPTSSVTRTLAALVRSAAHEGPVTAGRSAPYIEDTPKFKMFGAPSIARREPSLVGRMPVGAEGTASQFEMSPEQLMTTRMADAAGRLKLADLRQQTEAANMSVADRALMENKDVQTMAALTRATQPQIAAIEADAAKASALVTKAAMDPKLKEAELRRIVQDREDKLKRTQDLAAVMAGIRPSR